MDCPLGAVDDEVVDQRAVAGDRLGADSGRPGRTSAARSSGTKRRSSPTNAVRLAAWPSSPAPVRQWRAKQPPGAGPAERVARGRGGGPAEAVGVAGADHQRRGPEQHLAVDAPGQVHAEKREVGVGDRVDAGPDQLAALGAQPQVGAAEGNDARLGRGARRRPRGGPTSAPAQQIDAPAVVVPGAWRDRVAPPSGAASDRAAGDDAPPRRLELRGEARGDRGEVDDPGRGRVERGDPGRVGLDLAHLVRADPAQAGDLVLPPPALELVERAQLVLAGGDDHLAGGLTVGSRARRSRSRARARRPRTAGPSASRAGSRSPRGSRRWSAGLVRRDRRLPLEHHHPQAVVAQGSSRAVARPTIPAPTTTTSHSAGGSFLGTGAILVRPPGWWLGRKGARGSDFEGGPAGGQGRRQGPARASRLQRPTWRQRR